MRKLVAVLCSLFVVMSTVALLSGSAVAGTAPSVLSLSTHRGAYWGGNAVTIRGANFVKVKKVVFGKTRAWSLDVRSSREIKVIAPYHRYGKVTVRVVTATGTSGKNRVTSFTFAKPRMTDPIQGGLTGKQEQRISKKVRAKHRNVPTARGSGRWTAAMGVTAARRAASWIGIPYSWAGGNSRGPTKGVCAGDGGDLDCKIVGFDCSGLTLYAWAPYKSMAHYAATQRRQAGRFHPAAGELVAGDLVFFSGYISNGVGHTAIYVGNGNVVQAAQSGTTVMTSRLVDVIASHGKYRGATRPKSTGRQGAGPVVSAVTPSLPTTGGLLTVTGKAMAGTTAVTVSGKRYYSFVRRTATQVVVRVPAHKAGAGSIAVSNAWGTVKRSTTYVAGPTLTSLSAVQGPAVGGNTVTLTGTRLMQVTAVTVGTTKVAFRRYSDRSMAITMPARPTGGAVNVSVSSPYGTSRAIRYTYDAPLPTTPPSTSTSTAPGTTVPGTTGTTTGSTTGTPPPTSTSTPPSTPSTTGSTSAPSTSTTTATTTPPAPAQRNAPATTPASTPASTVSSTPKPAVVSPASG